MLGSSKIAMFELSIPTDPYLMYNKQTNIICFLKKKSCENESSPRVTIFYRLPLTSWKFLISVDVDKNGNPVNLK